MAVRENLFDVCQVLFVNYFQPLAVTENTHVWRESQMERRHLALRPLSVAPLTGP